MSNESKKHTKHTALIKPTGGEFHFNEWTLIGAPCNIIQDVAIKINLALQQHFKIAFLDAAHQSEKMEEEYFLHFTDKIDHQSIQTKQSIGQKQYRKYYNQLDLVLVNGNHFKGDKQIVFLNEKKKESLQRKLDRLDNVRCVISQHQDQELFDFLKNKINDDVPRIIISDLQALVNLMLQDFENNVPEVYGLVLAGGKSLRMGRDKGALEYKGVPHRDYLANLIQMHCKEVYLSCRQDQVRAWDSKYKKLTDSFIGLGPYGGILSAFRKQPNKAWLTLACDLPFMNEETLELLFAQRDPSKLATCFHNPETQFPEPLITIWEPRAYPVLLEFLSQGYSCPRKVLINSEIKEIHLEDSSILHNANDQESFLQAKLQIRES